MSANSHPARFVMATFFRGKYRTPWADAHATRRMAARKIKSKRRKPGKRLRRAANLPRSATQFRTIIAPARSTSQREKVMKARSQRESSRREFLAGAGASALAAAGAGPARAAMGPDDKFDLVIKGADVLDPSQS